MSARRWGPVLVVLALVTYAPLFWWSATESLERKEGLLMYDVGRLVPTRVKAVVGQETVEGLRETIAEARAEGLKVSIAGQRHSMGGHAFYDDALVLDMTTFDRILAIDPERRTVTVESGALWSEVIEAVNPHGLSVGVMQGYNSFTIGGSISVNVHESDPNHGPMVETVESFRLLLANGTILNVSRSENAELFSLVVGGYGLFGVILDATLLLQEDAVYRKHERVLRYDEYPTYFRTQHTPEVGQIFARLSIAQDEPFLRELVVTTYARTDEDAPELHELQPSATGLKKLVFGLSRMTDWGKEVRWYLQARYSDISDPPVISRNNLMNADAAFLEYRSATRTDILQEYFVPYDRLPEFIDDLRRVAEREDLNLLSATIRYIPENEESLMSYSRDEMFGLVLYFNVGRGEREQERAGEWTRELIDEALEKNGTYYLPYVPYATHDQMRQGYPNADLFFAKKDEYDPEHLFLSRFYETYGPR